MMDKAPDGTWQALFEKFDQDNPHIWEEFKRLAQEYIGANNFKLSSKDIISVIRWHTDLKTASDKKQAGKFRINDVFTSRYARKFIEQFPQHKDRFETRSIRSY
jgi:gentisate 1,2-dioxygenase